MKTINLAISGSGIRFGSQIGAWKYFYQKGYRCNEIVGTSGGAIVGACIAYGYTADEMEHLFMKVNLSKLDPFRPWLFRFTGGFFSIKNVKKMLKMYFKDKTLRDLPIKFTAVAHDYVLSRTVYLNKDFYPNMPVWEAVMYSMSIPFFYGYHRKIEPGTNNEMLLVDGAESNVYPISYIKGSKYKTVGLWVRGSNVQSFVPRNIRIKGNVSKKWLLQQYLRSHSDALTREYIEDADFAKTVAIPVIGISATNFDISDEDKRKLIVIGYNSAKKCVDDKGL